MKKFLINLDKVYKGVVLAVATIALMVGILEMLRVTSFPDNNFEFLPAENTIYAVSWINEYTNPDIKNLIEVVGIANAKYLLDYDENFLPSKVIDRVQPRSRKNKTIAMLTVDSEKDMVFVYKNPEEKESYFYNLDSWNIINKNGYTYITKNNKLANLLTTNFKPLTESERFMDSFSNIPKLTFMNAYVNNQLLDITLNTSNPILNQAVILKQLFGATTASLSVQKEGVYISTYTNPNNENDVTFPFTPKKYEATLMKYIPESPDSVIGGVDLTSRIKLWIENISGSATPHLLKNLLITNNLDESALLLFSSIFTNEYAIAYYNNEPLLILPKLGSPEEQNVIHQLQKIAANQNPKIISYQLEDGQIGRQLVPNTEAQYLTKSEDTYIFKVGDENIYFINKEVAYLTMSQDVVDILSQKFTPFFETEEFKSQYSKLMSVSDEVLYVNKENVSKFFGIPLEDTPSITTAFNYFDDGIQTVHFLAW